MIAKDVATYFIRKSSLLGRGVSGITNLKLQKLLFYTQAEYYQEYKKPLFEDEIEAWELGPVVPNVYHWLKEHSAYAITEFDIDTPNCKEPRRKEKEFLDRVWEKYHPYSASWLVDQVHAKSSVWKQVYDSGRNKIIELDMLSEVKLANEWALS